jgi:hypothetical protein
MTTLTPRVSDKVRPVPFVPAQAGTLGNASSRRPWIPACAGMNGERALGPPKQAFVPLT